MAACQKWKSEGRPVSTEPATYPPATFVPRPRPELIASKEDVLAAVTDKDVCIINALLEPEYTGDPAFPHHYGRPGHIPRSVNVPFVAVVDTNANNQFVPADELRQRFADAGALTSERVITYCAQNPVGFTPRVGSIPTSGTKSLGKRSRG